jgi:hypothetical protein
LLLRLQLRLQLRSLRLHRLLSCLLLRFFLRYLNLIRLPRLRLRLHLAAQIGC